MAQLQSILVYRSHVKTPADQGRVLSYLERKFDMSHWTQGKVTPRFTHIVFLRPGLKGRVRLRFKHFKHGLLLLAYPSKSKH